MRYAITPLIGVCCMLVPMSLRADVKKELQDRYALLNEAAAHKDIGKVMELHTGDYVHVTMKGTRMPASDLRKFVTYLFGVGSNIRGSNVIQKLSVKGNTAIVTVKNHVEAHMTDPHDRTVTAPMVSNSVTEDTWVKGKDGWQLKMSRDLQRKATVGGLLLPHK